MKLFFTRVGLKIVRDHFHGDQLFPQRHVCKETFPPPVNGIPIEFGGGFLIGQIYAAGFEAVFNPDFPLAS